MLAERERVTRYELQATDHKRKARSEQRKARSEDATKFLEAADVDVQAGSFYGKQLPTEDQLQRILQGIACLEESTSGNHRGC